MTRQAERTALRITKVAARRVDDSKLPPVGSFLERELGCQLSRADRRGEIKATVAFINRSPEGHSGKC